MNPCDANNNPCQNDGICSGELDGQATCNCEATEHWKGDYCEIPKDACDYFPCNNGGTCSVRTDGSLNEKSKLPRDCDCSTSIVDARNPTREGSDLKNLLLENVIDGFIHYQIKMIKDVLEMVIEVIVVIKDLMYVMLKVHLIQKEIL